METNANRLYVNVVKRSFLYFFAAILAACSATPSNLPGGTMQTKTTGTTPSWASSTITSLPSVTPVVPTDTPVGLPTPVPASWQIYTNDGLHIQLRFPSTWKADSPTRYQGPDGYFELARENYPLDDASCVVEANRDKPNRYGAFPDVGGWASPEGSYGCTVMPGEDHPATPNDQAVLYASYPPPWPVDRTLRLKTDSAHFGGILSTLQFIESNAFIPTNEANNSDECAIPPGVPSYNIDHVAGLTVTEYAIASAGCDPVQNFDVFQAELEELGLKRMLQSAYSKDTTQRMQAANRALAPFGYHLTDTGLYRGETAVVSITPRFGPVSVNASGSDFLLWVQDTLFNLPPIEVRKNSLRSLNVWDEGFNTAWVGPDLISFDYAADHLNPNGSSSQVIVKRNDQVIDTLAIPPEGPAGSPVHGFWSWDGHWVMEAADVVVQDGELQNPRLGFDEMFYWHPVQGKSFFFFYKDGSYGISYDGQILPQRYPILLHGPFCCETGNYNVTSLTSGAWFYAQREGVWYLVSVVATP